MNHYEVLGVVPDADAAAVRRAYLDLARQFHPDYHADAAAADRERYARRMQQVNDAWAVLGDPAERARYDRSLADPARPSAGRAGAGSDLPEGKGWTPRADDDGWMRDFAEWAAEDERLPDDGPEGPVRGVLAVAPLALFLLGLVCGTLGAAFGERGLVAGAFGLVVISAALFVLLPMLSMTRTRR